MTDTLDIEVHELTPEEESELLDTMADHYLGISFDAFREAWEAGRFEADPDQPGIARLALHLRERAA